MQSEAGNHSPGVDRAVQEATGKLPSFPEGWAGLSLAERRTVIQHVELSARQAEAPLPELERRLNLTREGASPSRSVDQFRYDDGMLRLKHLYTVLAELQRSP